MSNSTIQRTPAQKYVREEALLRFSTEKTEAGFLPELIKRLDCQMKMEHKNSQCPQNHSIHVCQVPA